MARSLKIAAYMAGLGRSTPAASPTFYPDRPDGAIIWARCSGPNS